MFFEKLTHGKSVENIIAKNASKEKEDNIWVRRWEDNQEALFPHFWENHFHINAILESKCLLGKILDFGCGSGHIDIVLAKKGLTVYGIDISPTAIEIANYYRDHLKQSVKNRVHFMLTTINAFHPNFKLDSCLMTDVLEHLPLETAKKIVTELRRLLVEDAPIFISVPYAKNYNDPDHCNFYYSLEEFTAFCNTIGLTVQNSRIDRQYNVIDAIASVSAEPQFTLNYPLEITQ
ncbi:MAG: class I SAM-dependent methyltransferase [Candidatus Bathyarchaeia archaeon]